MGAKSLSIKLGSSVQEAKKIIDDFYNEFPNVKKWIDNTNISAKENLYVEDLWGRRRRLPDLKLPKYEVSLKNSSDSTSFNPLLGSLGLFKKEKNPIIEKYLSMLNNAKDFKEVSRIKEMSKKDGVVIHDNGVKISNAERQCVNARIQGGAASMTKRAMISVHNDDVLNKLGFRMVVVVHDEIIGECPEENAQQAADRLCEIMMKSALPECICPFKCDPTIEKVWNEETYGGILRSTYKNLIDSGKSNDEALMSLNETFCECTEERIKNFIFS